MIGVSSKNLMVMTCEPRFSVVLGTPLQSAVNASLVHILKYLTGSAKTYANLTQVYVDVRNVALGHVMVYQGQS
uniref:Uncharacterized protein n=2 Tax=Brassica oleracea TaxID=3712 RepID=A0A0D3CVQ5_BRAOL|nr:unnamed protein product [Brassica oleracea]